MHDVHMFCHADLEEYSVSTGADCMHLIIQLDILGGTGAAFPAALQDFIIMLTVNPEAPGACRSCCMLTMTA